MSLVLLTPWSLSWIFISGVCAFLGGSSAPVQNFLGSFWRVSVSCGMIYAACLPQPSRCQLLSVDFSLAVALVFRRNVWPSLPKLEFCTSLSWCWTISTLVGSLQTSRSGGSLERFTLTSTTGFALFWLCVEVQEKSSHMLLDVPDLNWLRALCTLRISSLTVVFFRIPIADLWTALHTLKILIFLTWKRTLPWFPTVPWMPVGSSFREKDTGLWMTFSTTLCGCPMLSQSSCCMANPLIRSCYPHSSMRTRLNV